MKAIRRGSRFGHFRFVAELGSPALGQRWLVLNERERTNHTVHLFAPLTDSGQQRRALARIGTLASVQHGHLPRIQSYSLTPDHRPMIVTPYTGTHEGLLSLDDLCRSKGNTMGPQEVRRAVEQMLSALATAHTALPEDIRLGSFDASEIQVDRCGSLWLEGYGLRAAVMGEMPGYSPAAVIGDEVRSVVNIAYRLLSGTMPKVPAIPVGSLVARLDRSLERWVDVGLSPTAGYDDAASAIEALSSATVKSSSGTRVASTVGTRALARLWRRAAPVRVPSPVPAEDRHSAAMSSDATEHHGPTG